MIVEIPKNATKKQVEEAMEKMRRHLLKKKGKGNIAKHFGTLKMKEDGLTYQKRVRREWD
jgi:hypothetical protein